MKEKIQTNKLSKQKQKDFALEMYLEGFFTQSEICEIVGWTERTFYNHKKAGNWDELKNAQKTIPEKISIRLQKRILKLSEQLDNYKDGNDKDEDVILNKLVKYIDILAGLQKDYQNIQVFSQVATSFTEWLRPQDLDKAKEFIRLFKAFVSELINTTK